jgi:cephalosporin-C deacetylase-like acetyl esterase
MQKIIIVLIKISLLLVVYICFLSSSGEKGNVSKEQLRFIEITNPAKQRENLERLLGWLPPDRTASGRVSFLDETFQDWLERTGELPPDFDKMPSIPFLPDPLVLDEGGRNIPVNTMAQWEEKREWMKKHLEYYITGTYPSPPDNIKATILSERKDGEVTLQMIGLSFGPDHRAELTMELMIPPGKGPFPVFLTQWNHREWAQIAVRRGYIGCVYAGADWKDDTEHYSEIWAGEHDFTRLMRRAFGASRAVDYLYTLPFVEKESIGITGHSRNGKLSLMAAAFDERITACIPSSGGSGAEVPWRYASDNYDIEDIALLACAQPAWLHPRLRFFVGHEHKLPVDQNLFMALIAPRGLMLSTAITEGASNPWGIEQAWHSSKRVYEFLDAGDNLAIRSRYGLHSISARDMEDYLDFFDFVFGRSDHKPENRLFFDYNFDQWQGLSKENINPEDYPEKGVDDILTNNDNDIIRSVPAWERKKPNIRDRLHWLLGPEPPGVTNPGPVSLDRGGRGEVSFGTFLTRPGATSTMGVMAISPYRGFGDKLFGYLYYPADADGKPEKGNLPVVIYLHEFDYSKGFNSYHQVETLIRSMVDSGYAVFSYDMLGFGNRIEEGTRFYHRYPHWSKMGKMVSDARGAVEAMVNLDFIDGDRIFIAGYSLGATVGLFATAMDDRVAGVVSVAGFTPMRLNTPERGTEGIKAYSHLHGLIPRLGFFVGQADRIPVDFHEVLACIAPRPVLVIAPVFDKDSHLQDIRSSVAQAGKVFSLYGNPGNIEIFSPEDYNRFSPEMRERLYGWLRERGKRE